MSLKSALVTVQAPAGEYRTTALTGFHRFSLLEELAAALPPQLPYYLQLFLPNQARSGQWTQQLRWRCERLENIATRLQLELSGRRVFARA